MKGDKRKIIGTGERPRFCVYVSLNHIYAQIIDDMEGKTIVSASSLELKKGKNIDAAKEIGSLIGKRCLEKKISTVVFDRKDRKYHGKLKAAADAAREAGLTF